MKTKALFRNEAKEFLKRNYISIILATILLVLLILLAVFWNEVFYFGKQIFGSGDLTYFRSYVRNMGAPGIGVLIFVLLQLLQVFVTVVPSEPIQDAAGIVYGVGWGLLICWTAAVVGCMLVFFVSRKTKNIVITIRSQKRQNELTERFRKSGRNSVILVIMLFILPAITYGMVAIIAATCTKLKWWQYLIIMSVGSAVSITLTVFFGSWLVTHNTNPLAPTIVTICLIALIILMLIFRNRLLAFIFREKKTLDEKLNTYKVRRPSKLLYFFCMPAFKRKFIKKLNVHYNHLVDVKNLKPPFVVLSAHPSRWDYAYITCAMTPHKMNTLSNRWFFHHPVLAFFMRHVGAIPKKLFTADFNAMKNIMRVIDRKGIISISVEGINTISGANNPVIPSVAKMIKHLKLPVYSICIDGAFLTKPKWNYTSSSIGKIEVTVDALFTVEQLEDKTEAELLTAMSERFTYNDYKWARENKIIYQANERTKGLNNLLYICYNCKSEYKMVTGNNTIECTECGNSAFLDNSYQLNNVKKADKLPIDIAEWFVFQREIIRSEVNDKSFEMREPCTVKTYGKSGYRLYTKYNGEVIINKEGVRFIGTDLKTGEPAQIFASRKTLPMVANALGSSFEFYLDNNHYEFMLENGIKAVKCTVAINQIYQLYEDAKDAPTPAVQKQVKSPKKKVICNTP